MSERPLPRPVELLTSVPGDGPLYRSSYDGWLDLIRRAERRLILASYSFGHYDSDDSPEHPLFGALADVMHQRPQLAVDLLLSMQTLKKQGEHPSPFDLQRRLAKRVADNWVGGVRLPRLLGYAAEWEQDGTGRAKAVQHAKFAVCDGRWVLVTSANLTRAAFEENLEIGVVIEDAGLAGRLEGLVDSWILAGRSGDGGRGLREIPT